jgi:hypothetical protein
LIKQILSKIQEEIIQFQEELWPHIIEQFINGPNWLPPWVQKEIAVIGIDALLEFTAIATEEFTPGILFVFHRIHSSHPSHSKARWFEEIRGLADGVNNANVTYGT